MNRYSDPRDRVFVLRILLTGRQMLTRLMLTWQMLTCTWQMLKNPHAHEVLTKKGKRSQLTFIYFYLIENGRGVEVCRGRGSGERKGKKRAGGEECHMCEESIISTSLSLPPSLSLRLPLDRSLSRYIFRTLYIQISLSLNHSLFLRSPSFFLPICLSGNLRNFASFVEHCVQI